MQNREPDARSFAPPLTLPAMASALRVLVLIVVAGGGGASAAEAPPRDAATQTEWLATVGFETCPGRSEGRPVRGAVYIEQLEERHVHLTYALSGLDPLCSNLLTPSSSCMVGAGGAVSDHVIPWDRYRTYDGGAAADLDFTIAENRSLRSETAVVTDRSGAPAACSALEAFSVSETETVEVGAWERYPGYTGDFEVSGSVILGQATRLRDGRFGLGAALWLQGGDPACAKLGPTPAADACGVHVHVGSSCSSAEDVGGRLWDQGRFEGQAGLEDPWARVRYHPKLDMLMSPIMTGAEFSRVLGGTLVVSDAKGAPIACAEISAGPGGESEPSAHAPSFPPRRGARGA